MMMFDIAEWIANLLVLGVAFILWAIAIFMIAMLVSMSSQWIDNLKKGEQKWERKLEEIFQTTLEEQKIDSGLK